MEWECGGGWVGRVNKKARKVCMGRGPLSGSAVKDWLAHRLFIRTHADPTPGPDPAAADSMGPDGSRRTAGSTHGSPDPPRPREFPFGKKNPFPWAKLQVVELVLVMASTSN